MQEPIEPTEALEDSENVLIDDGVLSFEHVDFKYDVKKILDDVSFQIPQGQVSAFVGPSGSGKSTIFNLIERMYEIGSGDIKYGLEVSMISRYLSGDAKLDMLCNQIR